MFSSFDRDLKNIFTINEKQEMLLKILICLRTLSIWTASYSILLLKPFSKWPQTRLGEWPSHRKGSDVLGTQYQLLLSYLCLGSGWMCLEQRQNEPLCRWSCQHLVQKGWQESSYLCPNPWLKVGAAPRSDQASQDFTQFSLETPSG